MEGRGGKMRIREIISVVTAQTIFIYSFIPFFFLGKDGFIEINET